jgi:cysteine desulfurase
VEPLRQLVEQGFTVDHLPATNEGVVRPDALAGFSPETARLVCVMLVNHETGAIQPVEALVQQTGVPFHCDATQAVGKLPVDFHRLGVTTLSFSAHKFHGPVGIGALLVRDGTKLKARTWGGHQQQGRRPGTESVALAAGLATALELAVREQAERNAHVARRRAMFLDRLKQIAAPIIVNSPGEGSPYVVNVSFPGCRADALLMNLDLAGVACSTGSACSSGSLLPSPVLRAQGVSDDALQSAMRFSFSVMLSDEDIEEAARRIASVVERLRRAPTD